MQCRKLHRLAVRECSPGPTICVRRDASATLPGMTDEPTLTFAEHIDEALSHAEELAAPSGARPNLPAAVLAMPQMQALKQFALGAARHAAHSGMEKNEMKYLEAMGLDEATSEWVLS